MHEQWWETDVRSVLPTVRAPTLILTRPAAAHGELAAGFIETLHAAIPDSTLVELPGRDLPYWVGETGAFVAEIEEFFTGTRSAPLDTDRVLATVLFTDIVDSTSHAADLGDAAWQATRSRHDAVVRDALARHRGQEIKTMGDGFLATFSGPARGVGAALDIVTSVRGLGLQIRAGLHTGEITFEGSDISGIAVAIGARIGARAGASEVLVSRTVKDLVAGSGLSFEDAGEHKLKGVPDRWRLYRVVG
jgi:class 3 adenylate cyclase